MRATPVPLAFRAPAKIPRKWVSKEHPVHDDPNGPVRPQTVWRWATVGLILSEIGFVVSVGAPLVFFALLALFVWPDASALDYCSLGEIGDEIKKKNATVTYVFQLFRWWLSWDSVLSRDVRYGADARLRVDVYTPAAAARIINTNMDTSKTEDSRTTNVYDAKNGPRPMLCFFHGGAWGSGDKLLYASLGRYLSSDRSYSFDNCTNADFNQRLRQCAQRQSNDTEAKGVCAPVVLIFNYRRYPLGDAQTQVLDVETAVAWARRNGRRFGGDPSHIIVSGHSSGAHIVAQFLAKRVERHCAHEHTHDAFAHAKPSPCALFDKKPVTPWLRGFIGLSGVYDIDAHYVFETSRGVERLSTMRPAFLGVGPMRHQSPIFVLQRTARTCAVIGLEHAKYANVACDHFPPTLLMHGQTDATVPVASSEGLRDALDLLGVPVTMAVYPNVAHTELILGFMRHRQHTPAIMHDLKEFMVHLAEAKQPRFALHVVERGSQHRNASIENSAVLAELQPFGSAVLPATFTKRQSLDRRKMVHALRNSAAQVASMRQQLLSLDERIDELSGSPIARANAMRAVSTDFTFVDSVDLRIRALLERLRAESQKREEVRHSVVLRVASLNGVLADATCVSRRRLQRWVMCLAFMLWPLFYRRVATLFAFVVRARFAPLLGWIRKS